MQKEIDEMTREVQQETEGLIEEDMTKMKNLGIAMPELKNIPKYPAPAGHEPPRINSSI